jgi:small-conductance mechanosensitive channel
MTYFFIWLIGFIICFASFLFQGDKEEQAFFAAALWPIGLIFGIMLRFKP